jgi:signal transduction histidine kinase
MRSRDPWRADKKKLKAPDEPARARRPHEHSTGKVRRPNPPELEPAVVLGREHAGEILAAISHDLRTPLGVIMGAFQEIRAQLPDDAAAYERLIERSNERLVAIADRLTRAAGFLRGRNGPPKGVDTEVVLREAALAASSRLEGPLRVAVDRSATLAIDPVSAVSALTALFALADLAADPAVQAECQDRAFVLKIALAAEPRPDIELERAFSSHATRSHVDMDLFLARIELEAQGAVLALHSVGRALIVRLPTI